LRVICEAARKLDLAALTKLKIALVSSDRIIGVNYGCGHDGETDVTGDWKKLRDEDLPLSMLLEPVYVLTGANFEDHADSYKVDPCPEGEAESAIFASEPLTEDGDEWQEIEFGEIVFLERKDGLISKTVRKLDV